MIYRRSLLLCVLCMSFSAVATAQQVYCVTDLGASSWATGINSAGQVVGYTGTSNPLNNNYSNDQAFIWSNGTQTNLGVPAGFSNSVGYGINDSGSVVGWGMPTGGTYQHALAYENGQWYDLSSSLTGPAPYNYPTSIATAINNNGTIVGMGFSNVYSGGYTYTSGFSLTGVGGTATSLGPVTVGGGAYGINSTGVIVGGWQDAIETIDGGTTPWYDRGGVVSQADVSTLSSLPSGGALFAVGNDPTNNNPIMVGNYGDSGPPTAIAYSPLTMQFTDLSAAIPGQYQYPGSYDSRVSAYGKDEGVDAATAVASNGDIVGAATFANTLYADGTSVPWQNAGQDREKGIYRYQHAFIYTGGVTTDLNTYILGSTGFLLQGATGIAIVNGQEWIVGDALVNSVHHAFLMTPAMPGDANADGKVDINDLTIVLRTTARPAWRGTRANSPAAARWTSTI